MIPRVEVRINDTVHTNNDLLRGLPQYLTPVNNDQIIHMLNPNHIKPILNKLTPIVRGMT